MLDNGYLQWLGQISNSLYHPPVFGIAALSKKLGYERFAVLRLDMA
jgi:hypothetical protein